MNIPTANHQSRSATPANGWSSCVAESIADFSAAGLKRAHELVESGRMTGKVVVHR